MQPALFEIAIDFVGIIFERLSSSYEGEEGETLLKSLLPEIFLFGYLLPLCGRTVDSEDSEGSNGVNHQSYGVAKSLWEGWIKSAEEGVKREVVGMIKMRLKMLVEDTHIHPLLVSLFSPFIPVELRYIVFF